MSYRFIRAALILSLLIITPTAVGATLIDTGQPDTSQTSGGYSVFSQQFLAGRIDLAQSSVVTGIEAYMGDGGTGGTATIVLYPQTVSDIWNLPIPDTGVEQFSQTFTVSDITDPVNGLGWQGAYGLDWNLAAGSYWIAFEVRQGQTYDGHFPTLGPVPSPLPDYAWWYEPNGAWRNDTLSSNKWGLRVYGEPLSAVPVPASAWLFLSGVGMLAASIRRNIKQTQSSAAQSDARCCKD
ncbi:MAG: VPLPA-CTERM sorting domain-containing protein, partial [Gammaproteobacteria bacterium]|nr:VPLPA-CTERM sorting domain-containing protein [Gammaproteobacteria bacterium]